MTATSQKDKKFYVIFIISLVIMFGFGYLPSFGEVSPDGMRVLGIFLGCLFAWIFGEIVWSSILGVILMCAFGYGTMTENFAAAYGNNVTSVMIASVTFCYAIERTGLLSEVAKWIVGQKWAQKSVWRLVIAFYLAAMVLTIMTCNSVPVIILLWALYYELSKEIGAKPFDALTNIVLCGIVVAALVGNSVMPYNGLTVLVSGMAQTMNPGFVLNTGDFILINLVYCVTFFPIILLFVRFAFNSKMRQFEIQKRNTYKMNLNLESKVSLFILGVIIVLMIVPNFLSEGNLLRELCNTKLTVTGIFMLGAVILMVIHVAGKPILDIPRGISSVPWPLFLLVGAALCISNYLTQDNMGILSTISNFLGPIVDGKSPLAVTLIFMAIGLIMTNFVNDVATIMVLYPIAAQFIIEGGGSITLLTLLFTQAVVQGCFMPSGSMAGALMHGNSEWLKPKDVFKTVGLMQIAVLINILLVTIIRNLFGF